MVTTCSGVHSLWRLFLDLVRIRGGASCMPLVAVVSVEDIVSRKLGSKARERRLDDHAKETVLIA
jgi:hypothetical protein